MRTRQESNVYAEKTVNRFVGETYKIGAVFWAKFRSIEGKLSGVPAFVMGMSRESVRFCRHVPCSANRAGKRDDLASSNCTIPLTADIGRAKIRRRFYIGLLLLPVLLAFSFTKIIH